MYSFGNERKYEKSNFIDLASLSFRVLDCVALLSK